jgi:hypothetical protein
MVIFKVKNILFVIRIYSKMNLEKEKIRNKLENLRNKNDQNMKNLKC